MKDFSKYFSRIKNALNELEENKNLLKKAKYNKRIIEELENEIKVYKRKKLETIDLLDQTIADIENLTKDKNSKN
tara:strand:- start:390 stop:614 length:225 start_codon:yes stop_codon:yes gene_type:complete